MFCMHRLQHHKHSSTTFIARLIRLFSYQLEIQVGSHTTYENVSYNFDSSDVLALDCAQEVAVSCS
jgi:hypothetical protein